MPDPLGINIKKEKKQNLNIIIRLWRLGDLGVYNKVYSHYTLTLKTSLILNIQDSLRVK